MLAVNQRMAELWTIQKKRALNQEELHELELCLEANANWVWKKIELENMSLLASMTHDHIWQHDICRLLEKIDPAHGSIS